jgi:hypothetical protein
MERLVEASRHAISNTFFGSLISVFKSSERAQPYALSTKRDDLKLACTSCTCVLGIFLGVL